MSFGYIGHVVNGKSISKLVWIVVQILKLVWWLIAVAPSFIIWGSGWKVYLYLESVSIIAYIYYGVDNFVSLSNIFVMLLSGLFNNNKSLLLISFDSSKQFSSFTFYFIAHSLGSSMI